MQPEFYSIKQVAVIFSVHEITIRRAIHQGYIEAVKIGDGDRSPYRISRKCIDAIHTALLRNMTDKSKPSSSCDERENR